MPRTRTLVVAALLSLAFGSVSAQQSRPAITGISHMCVLAHDMSASADFYGRILGATKGPDLQDPNGTRFYFSPTQFVEVLPLPADHTGLSRISCVAFNTVDARALHAYLVAKGVTSASDIKTSTDGSRWFTTTDPEGNQVQFVQPGRSTVVIDNTKSISHRIIHVGYMVKNRADEDHFYRELLGFRPYWFGAMQPNRTDWISQEVPSGTDWIEYMMVGEGSDTPTNHVDARTLGVMNHFSLGVTNMEATVTKLYQQDRLPPRHDGPQMGRDGKWQANLYDPDGTRVELMEFQPVSKPCCSDFTAASPLH
jgi:catechol 2,3-dioxygenase-like lactoylglutathione lyase family enzyme